MTKRNANNSNAKDLQGAALSPDMSKKPLLLPIKPNHCRQSSLVKAPKTASNFANTLRQQSAPARKIIGKSVNQSSSSANDCTSETEKQTTASSQAIVNSNIGILAWPLNKNKPMQRGNG